MQFPRKTISASLINTYFDCPLAWKLLFVDELMQEEGPALEIGSMLDYMFKRYHQDQDWLVDAKDKYFTGKSNKEKIDNFGVAKDLMTIYLKDPDKFDNFTADIGFKIPIINPITGEKLPNVMLSGYLDGIADGRVKELKSTTEPYTQERVDNAIQGTIYAYYAYQKYKELYPVDYIVLGKKTKSVDRFTTHRTLEDFDKMFNTIKSFIEDVESEKFDQNPDHPFYCACRKLS